MVNKHFRMIGGIVCAPIKYFIRRNRHESTQNLLEAEAFDRKWQNDWERMHHFASMCNKAYTDSPLYNHLGELNN